MEPEMLRLETLRLSHCEFLEGKLNKEDVIQRANNYYGFLRGDHEASTANKEI